jgi:hypothetical protein
MDSPGIKSDTRAGDMSQLFLMIREGKERLGHFHSITRSLRKLREINETHNEEVLFAF